MGNAVGFVLEAHVIAESLDRGARGVWQRGYEADARNEQRETVQAAWRGRNFTQSDLDFEVDKRVAAMRESFVAAHMEELLHAMHVCNASLLNEAELFEALDTPVDAPRGAHLRVVR